MLTLKTAQQNNLWYLLLSLLIFFSFYFALGSYPLLNNNEGLYASIAKSMWQTKLFIIPHLNCVPYIEKPPLLYWLLSLSFSLFGYTAFAARFVTTTSAALLCIAIVYFTHKIKLTKIGIIAALIFASSACISIIARTVYFDMLFSFFVGTTLFCLFYWHETQKKIALRSSYLLFGLAILTKGLVAIILIGGSFGAFLLLEKSFWKTLRNSIDWPGVFLFLAIVLPWHIAAHIQHQGFFSNYIIGEHFLRFLSLREPHDYYSGPFYYYLPRILIYIFPWSFFTPLIFLQTKTATTLEKKLLRFCWCFLLVPLVFFSTAFIKANYYMIVSMPALAIILSIKLNELFASKYAKLFNISTAIILLAIAFIIWFCFYAVLPHFPTIIIYKKIMLAVILYGLIAAIVSLVFIKKSWLAAIALASFIIPNIIITTSVLKLISNTTSSAIAGIYLAENKNITPVYLYQDFEKISALSFYSNTCFKTIDSQSYDLYYGSHLPESKHWFLTAEEFLRETKHRPFYMIVPTKKLESFYQKIIVKNIFILKKYPDLTIFGFK
jgi:4-amino-4-deoxy-L-arabinose transferase-like glycosyltransferase